MARQVGSTVDLSESMQSILLVETNAGEAGKVGDKGRSLGAMQVRPETAQYVTNLGHYQLPKMKSTYHYAVSLMRDKYNMQVARAYLSRCMQVYKQWRRGIVCYNKGVAGAKRLSNKEIDSDPYLLKVIRTMKNVREFRLAKRGSNIIKRRGSELRHKQEFLGLLSTSIKYAIPHNFLPILCNGYGDNVGLNVQRSLFVSTRPYKRAGRIHVPQSRAGIT